MSEASSWEYVSIVIAIADVMERQVALSRYNCVLFIVASLVAPA